MVIIIANIYSVCEKVATCSTCMSSSYTYIHIYNYYPDLIHEETDSEAFCVRPRTHSWRVWDVGFKLGLPDSEPCNHYKVPPGKAQSTRLGSAAASLGAQHTEVTSAFLLATGSQPGLTTLLLRSACVGDTCFRFQGL